MASDILMMMFIILQLGLMAIGGLLMMAVFNFFYNAYQRKVRYKRLMGICKR